MVVSINVGGGGGGGGGPQYVIIFVIGTFKTGTPISESSPSCDVFALQCLGFGVILGT